MNEYTSSISTQHLKQVGHFKNLFSDYKKDREQANICLNSYKEKYNILLEEND